MRFSNHVGRKFSWRSLEITCHCRLFWIASAVVLLTLPTTTVTAKKFKFFKKLQKSFYGVEVRGGYDYQQGHLINDPATKDFDYSSFNPTASAVIYFVPKFKIKPGLSFSFFQMDTLTGQILEGDETFYSFTVKPQLASLDNWLISTGVTLWAAFQPKFLKKRKLEWALAAESGLIFGNAETNITFTKSATNKTRGLSGARLNALMQSGGWYWQVGTGVNWVKKKNYHIGLRFDYRQVGVLAFGSKAPYLYDFPDSVDKDKIEYQEDIPEAAVYDSNHFFSVSVVMMWTKKK